MTTSFFEKTWFSQLFVGINSKASSQEPNRVHLNTQKKVIEGSSEVEITVNPDFEDWFAQDQMLLG